jgi:hypothetical protein
VTLPSNTRRSGSKPRLLQGVFVLGFALCVISACGSGSQSPTTTPSSADGQAVDYGPLAVLPPSEFRSLAGGRAGPIRIGHECVTVEAPEGLALLIWHSEDVTWDEETRSLTFTSIKPSVTPITIRDGDKYQFGGISDQGITRGLTFLVPPDEMCQGTRLIVDFVEIHGLWSLGPRRPI